MKTDVSVVRLVVCKVNLLEGTHRPQAFDSAQKTFFFLPKYVKIGASSQTL